MRIVTNQKKIDRNKKTAQTLFFASIGALVGSFFLGNSLSDNGNATFYLQCIGLPILIILVVLSVRMTNQWVRQPYPWDSIKEGLKGTGGDTVMYNFLMPASHVLIGPSGIFAITTRFQDRPQAINDDTWKSTSNILTYMRQEQLGDPTKEALLKSAQTETFLQELLQDSDIEVQPLVVFVHPNANVTMEGKQTVPVLYASDEKKKQSLKSYLRDAKKKEYITLTKEQIAELDDVLLFED